MHWWHMLYPEDELAPITNPPHKTLTLSAMCDIRYGAKYAQEPRLPT